MSAPIYKGKDLVLDVDEHNRVISKLLTRQKGEPESPTPEVCEEFPWAKVMGADAASRRGLNEQALRVLKTCLIFAAYFLLVSTHTKFFCFSFKWWEMCSIFHNGNTKFVNFSFLCWEQIPQRV